MKIVVNYKNLRNFIFRTRFAKSTRIRSTLSKLTKIKPIKLHEYEKLFS